MRRWAIIAVSVASVFVGVGGARGGNTPTQHEAVASVYVAAGGPLACGGVGGVGELIVAHKTLPCGTRVMLCYPAVFGARGRRCVAATVRDRGPYVVGRTWDLAVATAHALGFPMGYGPVGYSLLR